MAGVVCPQLHFSTFHTNVCSVVVAVSVIWITRYSNLGVVCFRREEGKAYSLLGLFRILYREQNTSIGDWITCWINVRMYMYVYSIIRGPQGLQHVWRNDTSCSLHICPISDINLGINLRIRPNYRWFGYSSLTHKLNQDKLYPIKNVSCCGQNH